MRLPVAKTADLTAAFTTGLAPGFTTGLPASLTDALLIHLLAGFNIAFTGTGGKGVPGRGDVGKGDAGKGDAGKGTGGKGDAVSGIEGTDATGTVVVMLGATRALFNCAKGFFSCFFKSLLASRMKAVTAGYTASRQRLPLKIP